MSDEQMKAMLMGVVWVIVGTTLTAVIHPFWVAVGIGCITAVFVGTARGIWERRRR